MQSFRLNSLSIAAMAAAILVATPLGAVSAHDYKVGTIAIDHPWARPTAPSAPTGGAFMVLRNSGSEADRLLRAESPAARKTELHTHIDDNGVMKMREVKAIDVPGKGETTLAPGGLHVMLMGLKAPLAEGTKVPLTLTFERAGTVTVELSVEKKSMAGGHGAAHKH